MNTSGKKSWITSHFIAGSAYTDIVGLLLDYGVDINSAGKCGGTILIKAVMDSGIDTIKLLLSRKADVNFQDHLTENTALYYEFKVFDYLVDNIAKPMDNVINMVKFLLKYGADPSITNNNSKTP